MRRYLALAVAAGYLVVSAPGVPAQGTKWGLRGEAMATQGMVSAAHPLAALAGVKMLASGGNAVDAIVAAAAALSVVEPGSSGVGGVGFLLLYSAEEQRVRALPFGGRAPKGVAGPITREETTTGPKAPLVPGNPAGWAKVLADYGTKSLAEVLAPAIEYAEKGVPFNQVEADRLAAALERISPHADAAAVYLKADGTPYAEGELFRNEPQARVLRLLAEHGIDVFYRGELAREFAAAFQRDGGFMRLEDLEAFPESVQWVDPISIRYKGDTVYAVPPPNSGLQILQSLKVLEGFDLRAMDHNSVEYVAHLAETFRLGRLDTDRYIADPRFVDVPVTRLLSDDYIARRRTEIGDRLRGTESSGMVYRPEIRLADELITQSTTHLTAVDRWGNAINITQTLGSTYGSGYMPGRTGLIFNNAARWFNLEPGHPNLIEPGKDVEWCIAPIQVHRNGRPFFVGGSPGSYGITQTVPQVILNVLEFGMNIQDAVSAPRFRWADETVPATRINIETRFAGEVIEGLRARGYDLNLIGDWSQGVGGAHAILVHPETGWLTGGADPRRSGHALGW